MFIFLYFSNDTGLMVDCLGNVIFTYKFTVAEFIGPPVCCCVMFEWRKKKTFCKMILQGGERFFFKFGFHPFFNKNYTNWRIKPTTQIKKLTIHYSSTNISSPKFFSK
mmetsp:Transcript_29883/g.43508  ORF Transcript_29883/g.43508 Transcript_29883/m.43508 type:complete len:108 (+) Transcript_29883:721-1044(+)